MTEVMDTGDARAFADNFVLDDPAPELLQHAPREYTHDSHDVVLPVGLTPTPRLEDVDKAYGHRKIKYARAILDRLMHHMPYFYSPRQNRVALNDLAHPVQQLLALEQYGGAIPTDLTKDIEAIYGCGAEQLKFLLHQEAAIRNTNIHASIEGGLSELTVFLLAVRQLTGETSDPYLIVPSAEAEDNAQITPDGLHHGFDFKVIRRWDNTTIPLQVKTRTAHATKYSDDILVVSVADLVHDHSRAVQPTPLALAESLYFEISGARNYDKQLITIAKQRLFSAFDNYDANSNR